MGVVETAGLGAEFLEHYGVRGMRWGVRRAEKAEGKGNSAKAEKIMNKLDKRWEKKAGGIDAFVEIHNGVTNEFNSKITGINKKYDGVDLTKHTNREKRDAYDREVEDMMRTAYQNSAARVKSPSGKQQLTLDFKDDGSFAIKAKKVQHADNAITGRLVRDDNGLIVGVTFDFLEHARVEAGEEFLAHFGVKGMRWGVRRDRNTPGRIERQTAKVESNTRAKRSRVAVTPRVQDSIGTSTRKKTTIKARGGEDHPAADDAIRVAATRQKLKKSGINALSNDELRDLATRSNLEVQVKQLESKRPKSLGKQATEALLADPVGSIDTGIKVTKFVRGR